MILAEKTTRLILRTNTGWGVKQVPPTLSQEVGIQPPRGVHSGDGDDDRVLKLIRAREEDGRGVGEHFEQVLERRLDSRERPSVIVLDFLSHALSVEPSEFNAVDDNPIRRERSFNLHLV